MPFQSLTSHMMLSDIAISDISANTRPTFKPSSNLLTSLLAPVPTLNPALFRHTTDLGYGWYYSLSDDRSITYDPLVAKLNLRAQHALLSRSTGSFSSTYDIYISSNLGFAKIYTRSIFLFPYRR